MPSIHLPATMAALLPYCRKSEEAVNHACFDTYADLVVFAASFGFHQLSGAKPDPPKAFLDLPYPIDLMTFRSQRSFSQLILIGLATEGNREIARDEERLCRLVEGFAAVGGKELTKILEQSTPASFYLELANLLEEATSEQLSEKI